MKFKKVSLSLSTHRRKELKEPTNVKNGSAKLSKSEHIRMDGQMGRRSDGQADRQTDRQQTDNGCIYKYMYCRL